MSAFVAPTPFALSTSGRCFCTSPARLSAGSLRAAGFATRTLLTPARVAPGTLTLTMEMEVDEEPMDTRDDEPSIPPGETKLFVGNLSWGTTDASLGAAFAVIGTVVDSRVVVDRFTGKSRGFGFIEYQDAAAAKSAITEMNGVEVDGRAVRVDWANPRTQKPRRQSSYY